MWSEDLEKEPLSNDPTNLSIINSSKKDDEFNDYISFTDDNHDQFLISDEKKRQRP